MGIELQDFEVSVPSKNGGGIAEFITIRIPMQWDDELETWLMTERGLRQLEETKRRGFTARVNV